MPFTFSLAGYGEYADRVGAATYIDMSRRTDPACIPKVWQSLQQVELAFGAPWMLQLWTKDPAGVIRRGADILPRLRQAGTTITVQLTITGLAGSPWEPLVPVDAIRAIPELARLVGGVKHICWRYDPIIPGVHRSEVFRDLAQRIAGYGLERGVINFIAPPGRYKRVDRRLGTLIPGWQDDMPDYNSEWRQSIARELVVLAEPLGIRLACCAEESGLPQSVPGLARAACGDYAWFCSLSGRQPPVHIGKGSRLGCGCAPYYDIGSYGHWTQCHRCLYCYAG
jgi:hypothetical protein